MDASGADLRDREKQTSKHSKQPFRALVTSSGKVKKKTKKKERTNSIKKRGRTSSTPTTSDEADKHNAKSKKSQKHIPLPLSPRDVSMTKHKLKKDDAECDTEKSNPSGSSSSIAQEGAVNESLRWEGALDDPVAEEERIQQYKINRRKRYLLAAQQATCNNSNSENSLHEDLKLEPCTPVLPSSDSAAKRDYSNSSFIGQNGQPKQVSALQFPALVNMFKNHL
ncbi:hypothetical protein XENTR_v10006105 [Xenopus tropicalis]|uniref:Protein LIAT1 n=1 Tax=Xenopus tropicalis TaxID=8364 RepID=A0A8J0SFE8_XENTR|nr:protein LIAT1 [Xenopus tropicalis]XP_031752824.1 protein LIAT1 [Xenopus tropicalis]KAE8624956.1 hypothetical protein XENTR_v10006105 [Xenopus tropicalis]KAE8624957.1 hypothetical protein XENTR_v10006105 [Xenopus tropicalis]KAE8624958.1 hypothetical protein XENTR_v10006105 [Xenopus tropicalis]KAE8624959.1 hypothetical protein XENTR_v10006105 [Xenopus tropicalis]